jgi:hypothetical protein
LGRGFFFAAIAGDVVASATATAAISAVRGRMGDSAGVEVVEAVFYGVEPCASPEGLHEFTQRVKLVIHRLPGEARNPANDVIVP